jgi:uncharacterized membrane protein YfcA
MADMSLALGIVVGLILGLTGAGGSIFAVPLLMAALGWSMTQAAPVALLSVACASALGTYIAWRKSYVRYRAALLISAVGVAFSPLGLIAADHLPQNILGLLFSLVLVIVAARMIRQTILAPDESVVLRAAVSGDGSHTDGPICRLTSSGRILWTRPCACVLSAIGAVTGFLSGLLGVGGGFVIVPSLRASSALSMHSAVATSLMVIALTSSGTVLSAIAQGRQIPWLVALPFVVGSLLGMLGGGRLAPRIAGVRLQQMFAVLMLLVAAGLSLRSLGWL